ncbi:MAG: hypothetical protein IPP66_09265 [Anaerolineales bacterium]|nr:hypothetical protein [Anaerolineales bacterium]
MDRVKPFNKILSIVGILLIISACQRSSESALKLQENLRSDNCIPLCWEGIQPGLTSSESAKEILIEKYGEERISIEENWIDFSANNDDLLNKGSFSINKEVVQEVYISLNEMISVDDLLSVLGNPTYVLVDGVNECLGSHLWFMDDGIFAHIDNPDTPSKGITKTQYVLLLRLTAVDAIDESQIYDANLIKWDGYKDYCKLVFGD